MNEGINARTLGLFNFFADGRGYAGKIDELEPPKLGIKTEEYRPGGFDAPIETDMGMEKLEANFTLLDWDKHVLTYFGLGHNKPVASTVRGAVNNGDGTVNAHVYQLQGMWKEVEQPKLKAGEKLSMKVTIALKYYKLEIDGAVVHEIDVENAVRIINGVDVLAAQREAAGI